MTGLHTGRRWAPEPASELTALQRTWASRTEEYFPLVEKLTADLVGYGHRVEGLTDWCRKWLTATNRLDTEGLAVLVAPDVLWNDPLLFGRSVHGREEFRTYLGLFWRAVKNLQLYPVGPPMIYPAEDSLHFCQPWHAVGSWTGPLDMWPVREAGPVLGPTGRLLDFDGVDRYVFAVDADGGVDWHVTQGHTVYCTANVLHQAGLFPHPAGRAMGPVRAAMRTAAFVIRHMASRRGSVS